ncbi:MarR family transcriptional regulator [Nonomuraea sp. NPDC049141]|uniref:MarR family transcriptional regulator n=1 Tax=Nonomuraea sp. NPDC049141 TaxID=3155500 RepID=UPI0033EA7EF3
MATRVLACLYVTDSGTLTVADLVQRLRVSPASISQTVAFLEQQGLLKRARRPSHLRLPAVAGLRPYRAELRRRLGHANDRIGTCIPTRRTTSPPGT